MKKKKPKKRAKPPQKAHPTPKPLSLADQYGQKANHQLAELISQFNDPDNPPVNARAQLDSAIDNVLKSFALGEIDQAHHNRSMGYLSTEEHERTVNQALDRFNDPALETRKRPAPSGPLYITGLDGELIYLGD